MAPKEVHEIVGRLRTQHDEEILDLIRDTVAQLNKLGDKLESYLWREAPESHGETSNSENQSPDV